MNSSNDAVRGSASIRPSDVCRALLGALDAAEGRRRRRKRDQTPDAIGLGVKRLLLERAIADDPPPEAFEGWLITFPKTLNTPELHGPAFALARAVFEEWQLAHSSHQFRDWLEHGAPSDDASDGTRDQVSSASAVILAGGRSSRMGRSKALLPFGDSPLIVHLVERLRQLCHDIVVVAAPDQELPALAATVVRDEVEYQGPVGGLVYGLRAAAHDLTFVSSCDAPFLNLQLAAFFLSRAADYDVVVPRWQGRLQPLHAAYRRSVLPVLEEQLARGELRPVTLFDRVRTLIIEEEEITPIDPEGASFMNMNTPEEYADALDRWVRSRPR